MRKSNIAIVGIVVTIALSGCGNKADTALSTQDLTEESLASSLDKIIYEDITEEAGKNKPLSDKEIEESLEIDKAESESVAKELESLSDVLNNRTDRNHAETSTSGNEAVGDDGNIGAEETGETGNGNTDSTLEDLNNQPDYSEDEEVKEADKKLNKPNEVLTVTDTVEFSVGGADEYDKEQVAKIGSIWVYISPAVVKGGYAVLNNGNQCRIAIGTAETYQSYCDIYELHRGEFDRSLITDKFVAQKIRETYGLSNGMLELEEQDEVDTYISKVYSYNYKDAAGLFWCKQGVYLFRWHSDIGGNYLYPMSNILPDYAYNNSGSILNE